MNVTGILIKRNIKLFFKDKGMFFTSLITPMILLVLYATFLGNVYKDSLLSSIPKGIEIADKIVKITTTAGIIISDIEPLNTTTSGLAFTLLSPFSIILFSISICTRLFSPFWGPWNCDSIFVDIDGEPNVA